MKKLPPLLIVADRGRLLAYAVDDAARGQTLMLLQSVHLAEGRDRLSEQVTDQAGGFPNGGTAGQGNSTAELMTLVAELEMRTFRRAAQVIMEIFGKLQPQAWGFAAPSEINGAILDGLPADLQERLTLNLRHDLTRVPQAELLDHFRSAEK